MEADTATEMTVDILDELGDALSRRDMDTAMTYFTEDCVYMPSAGVSTRGEFRGRDQVRAGLSAFLNSVANGRFEPVRFALAGEQGFEEWHFVGTNDDGSKIDVHGCDYYEFRGNKVRMKNCFRKVP